MPAPDLWYRSSPFAHVCFLVSEALNPRLRSQTATTPQPTTPTRRGWLERLDQWAWRSRRREREAYLEQATDLPDLETRLRELERRVGPRSY